MRLLVRDHESVLGVEVIRAWGGFLFVVHGLYQGWSSFLCVEMSIRFMIQSLRRLPGRSDSSGDASWLKHICDVDDAWCSESATLGDGLALLGVARLAGTSLEFWLWDDININFFFFQGKHHSISKFAVVKQDGILDRSVNFENRL